MRKRLENFKAGDKIRYVVAFIQATSILLFLCSICEIVGEENIRISQYIKFLESKFSPGCYFNTQFNEILFSFC